MLSLNADGSVEWAKSFGGASRTEGKAVATRANGTAVVTGFFYGVTIVGATTLTSIASDEGRYTRDVFTVGLDTDGNVSLASGNV